jgi:hypothetical protein
MSTVDTQTDAAMSASNFITRRISRAMQTSLMPDSVAGPAKVVALTRCLRETISLAPEAERASLIELMLGCLGLDALFETEEAP